MAELQRKSSAKSLVALATNAASSSPESTATIAEMARMLSDLESKIGPSHPATILLRTQLEEAKRERDGAKPLLEKIQAAEKRLKTRQKAVEAAIAKRHQLQQSLQAAWEKLSRNSHGSRTQSSWIFAHKWQLTCGWQRAHQFVRRKDARRSWRLWMRPQKGRGATPRAHVRCAGGAQAAGGHDGDASSPGPCSGITCGY